MAGTMVLLGVFSCPLQSCPSVVLSGHNKYVQINKNERQEGMFRVSPSPSNIHDVDGVVCQLVCKSIRAQMFQLQQEC